MRRVSRVCVSLCHARCSAHPPHGRKSVPAASRPLSSSQQQDRVALPRESAAQVSEWMCTTRRAYAAGPTTLTCQRAQHVRGSGSACRRSTSLVYGGVCKEAVLDPKGLRGAAMVRVLRAPGPAVLQSADSRARPREGAPHGVGLGQHLRVDRRVPRSTGGGPVPEGHAEHVGAAGRPHGGQLRAAEL